MYKKDINKHYENYLKKLKYIYYNGAFSFKPNSNNEYQK